MTDRDERGTSKGRGAQAGRGPGAHDGRKHDAAGAHRPEHRKEGAHADRAKAAAEPAAPNAEETSQLRESLEAKTAECDKYKDSLLRLQAEFENYRKRMVREQTQFLDRAVEGFVGQLLPIIDNLERAIAAAEEKHDLEQLSEGVQMVHSQIIDLFGKEGIEIIDPVGEQFDPTKHHAMMQVEDAEHDDETVVEVVQKGCSLKGKILRPAMVKVSRKPK